MAPSANPWISPDEVAAEITTSGHIDSDEEQHNIPPVDGISKFYTDAYTHGYTEGYIKGYESELPKQVPIAIVGMSCRLPGNVTTPDEFWELCSRARTGWSEIPKERFENASFHHPNPGKGGCFSAAGGNFLKEDLGLFDAPFFSLTAQEATSMDPQQRMLLECTFEALDSAGIPKHEIVGKDVGVFIGGSFSEYESQLLADTETIPMFQATGCAFAMQSNRLSHFFDLRGPSFTMDTACSSSLVALHQACQSLRNGESKTAIVGGCHLNMLPEFWVSFAKSRLFSDEGRSFSFDSRGTGYGRGEGCGMVILKPLDQALKDNDNIRSVILASGINQDGKTPGITMPNGSAQESLMKSVYAAAGLNPKDTGYVEAHGTGTKVGDPIEAEALYNVFGEGRNARNPLFIGSVKSNIGHLEAASGIIAVIKTALMLERGFVLPNYDFKKPNEKIPFSKWHLKVPISQRPWPRPKKFASVNNFGFGGTNAHVVMERAPLVKEPEQEQEPESSEATTKHTRKLFVLSANDKTALETMMKNLGIYLEARPEFFEKDLMGNVAYTLGQRRSLMQWRVAIPSALSFDLNEALNSGKIVPVRETEAPRIGFVFTGQGAQWATMGRALYDQYPVFASTINTCDVFLKSLGSPFSLIVELQKDASTSSINEAHISQPSCTAIQIALTDLLRSWGVSPTAVAGHSSGEIAAAYAAGILPLEPCMAISYHRGTVTKKLKKKFPDLKGSMMAVGGSKEEIIPILEQMENRGARIACYNSPTSLTISGDEAAIDELQVILNEKQTFNRKLQVDVAYHSHHMELVAKEYRDSIQLLQSPQSTDVKFHSSLFGQLIEGSKLEPYYWVDNLTQSVRFAEAVASMCAPTEVHKTGVNILIEIGPHSALAGPAKQILKACGANAMKIPYTSALVRNKDAVETALDLAATLFVRGVNLDLGAVNLPGSQPPTLLVDMPRYPWNHQTKYWHEPRVMQKHKNRTISRNDLLGTLATYSNDLEPTWRNIIRIDDLPWLRHHKIQSLVLFPMSGFISMAVQAASQMAISRNVQYDSYELRSIVVSTPLMVTDEDVELTLQLRPQQDISASDLWDEFVICSWAANKGWTEHCKGLVMVRNKTADHFNNDAILQNAESSLQSAIDAVSGSGMVAIDRKSIYDSLSSLGVDYGTSFQGMIDCEASETGSKASIKVVDTAAEMPQGFQTDMIIHPAILEQLVEMYWPILGAGRTSIDTVFLPSSIDGMTLSRRVTELVAKPGNSLQAYCKGNAPGPYPKPIQVSIFATESTQSKEALITVENLTISPILERELSTDEDAYRELCYKLDWEEALQPIQSTSVNGVATNGILNGISNGIHESVNGVLNGISKAISDKPEEKPKPNLTPVVIVHGPSDAQRDLAAKLSETIAYLTGDLPKSGSLGEVETDGKLCVFLAELEESLLPSISSLEFESLHKLLTGVAGILWAVRGAYQNSTNPNANMVTGLSRSIRSETLLKFAILDLDSKSILTTEDTAKAIFKVFEATLGPDATPNCELEFMERNGTFLTPRIINDAEMNEYVHKQTKASIIEPALFLEKARPLQMVIGTPGALDTLHFEDQILDENLPDDEIEIEVKAIGLSSRDLISAMGQLDTFDFGTECSGIVVKAGRDVKDIPLGTRVCAISVAQGVVSTYARVKALFTVKINKDISFEDAAKLPMAYCAASYGLVDLGHVSAEDVVLIHGAASAPGQAAVVQAQLAGAEVYASVNSLASKEILTKTYGVPEDHVMNHQHHSFGSSIRQISRRSGFDIVLSCIPTNFEVSRDISNGLTDFGRFITLGKQDFSKLATTGGNRSFMSIDMISLALMRPRVMGRLILNISDKLAQGKMKPITSVTTFAIPDVEAAFKLLQAENAEDNVVIVPQSGDMVKATLSNKGPRMLRSDASYILIGGTGGLGRSMARWMVSQGARNIVLVSRSGSSTGKVRELIDELAAIGANVVVRRCDVSSRESVDKFIATELNGMPEIRGVVHGAMVLDDVLFEKMTHEQYTKVIESKVAGAWNFHHALSPFSLDFFIAISSAAGAVGNRGQAAYAAANTFLNALIQYRRALSLSGSSIDLTAISDTGYLAENAAAAAEVAKNLGSDTICEKEVLALLGAAINGKMGALCNGHTITGMRITTPPPFWTNDAKFKHLRLASEAQSSNGTGEVVSFNAQLKAAPSLAEAQDVVCRGLLNKLPSVLMLEAEDMDVTRSLSNYDMDSLNAIEVRNFITREFEANLQVLELLSSGSIETLAKAICIKSKLVSFEE